MRDWWIAIVVIGVGCFLFWKFDDMPTDEDCQIEAERRGIPCEIDSVRWVGAECKCLHSTEFYEIEFSFR